MSVIKIDSFGSAVNEYASAFEMALDYHFANTISKIGSFSEFLEIIQGSDNKSLARKIALFSLPTKSIVPPVRIGSSVKKIAKSVVSSISESYVLIGKKDVHYKSGKEFHRPSIWIPTKAKLDWLRRNWKNLSAKKKNLENFTKLEIKLIDRLCKSHAKGSEPEKNETVQNNEQTPKTVQSEKPEAPVVESYEVNHVKNKFEKRAEFDKMVEKELEDVDFAEIAV